MRLCGWLAWLGGDHPGALKLWKKGLATATRQSAQHTLARIHLELGQRQNDAFHLDRAQTLMIETGATQLAKLDA